MVELSKDELQDLFDNYEGLKEQKLTPRQQWFRRLLDELYDIDPHASLSQQQVYDQYQLDLARGDNVVYPEMAQGENEHNSGALRAIRADFRAIKVKNTQGVYISSTKGYKRATEDEALPYLEKKLKFILCELKEYWEQVDRNYNNGQMRLKLSKYQNEVYDPYKQFRKEDGK